MAAPRPKSAPVDRIESAQQQLVDANRQIAELTEERNRALLKDDGTAAAMDLGIKIANIKNAARAHEDRIQLLRTQAAEEAAARAKAEREAAIERVEKLLAQRDAAAAELAAAVKQSDAAFRKMLDTGQAVIAAWPWASQDIDATLLSPRAVTVITTHEIYKTGARPRRFGGMDKPGDGLDFPGGRCPSVQLTNLQQEIKSVTTVCAEASALASSIMRTGRSTSHVDPVAVFINGQGEPRQRTAAEQRLASLLKQQMELAEDVTPAGEKAYALIVSEIVKAQAEVTAEKSMEAQHA
jgi:hypothetical protein